MARVCDVTGKRPVSGYRVSHSNNHRKRRFLPNLQEKRFYLPSEERWIKLKVSAHGIRIINRQGIEKVVKKMRAEGKKV